MARERRTKDGMEHQPVERDRLLTPTMRFRIDTKNIPWVYACLMSEEHTAVLYTGPFSEPFQKLHYVLGASQNHLIFAAILEPHEQFDQEVKHPIGDEKTLEKLLRRYDTHEYSTDQRQLILFKGDEVQGVISRDDESRINIQKRTEFKPADETAMNALNLEIDQFNLLVQRYVGSIWASSPDTGIRELDLRLTVPSLPDGAAATYFSTFEIVGKDFREYPRDLSLEDIGGYPRAKELVRSLVMDVVDPETSRKFGTQPYSNKFILLSGDEGTGKSLFPKALHHLLKEHYGDDFEHFRLNLGELINERGPQAASVISTILDHIKENEKAGKATLLHLDAIESLMSPQERNTYQFGGNSPAMSSVEFGYYMQTGNPIRIALRHFGQELGAESKHVIVVGESRIPRGDLPEDLSRTFRRAVHLLPNKDDLAEILRVQMKTTKHFARRANRNPFSKETESQIEKIATGAEGLTGRDIQQALLAITTRLKANYDGAVLPEITPSEISEAIELIKTTRGLSSPSKTRRLGFNTSSTSV